LSPIQPIDLPAEVGSAALQRIWRVSGPPIAALFLLLSVAAPFAESGLIAWLVAVYFLLAGLLVGGASLALNRGRPHPERISGNGIHLPGYVVVPWSSVSEVRLIWMSRLFAARVTLEGRERWVVSIPPDDALLLEEVVRRAWSHRAPDVEVERRRGYTAIRPAQPEPASAEHVS
jgi:hypothetical protein